MSKFCLYYRQGSFAFSELCGTFKEAFSLALTIRQRPGVWQMRLEDEGGAMLVDLLGSDPGNHPLQKNIDY